MKFTNKYGYPSAVVHAVLNDTYSRGDSEFSATTLIAPPRIEVLREKHRSDIVLDVDDRIFILYGKIGHAILEASGRGLGRGVVEVRYFGLSGTTKISAQVDSLDLEEDGTLVDYKFTSVYGFKLGSAPKAEWTAQLNIQLELLRQNNLEATRLRIVGMLRDWRPAEKSKQAGYPDKIAHHDIEMWSRSKTQEFIASAIASHRRAKVELPLCTAEENWNGRRCAQYCDVSKFCEQYQSQLK